MCDLLQHQETTYETCDANNAASVTRMWWRTTLTGHAWCCTVLTLPIFNKVGNGKWARAALPRSEAGTRAFVSDAKDGASLAQLVDHFECPLQFR